MCLAGPTTSIYSTTIIIVAISLLVWIPLLVRTAPERANSAHPSLVAGDQGWELVTITTNSMAYFKRQLEDTVSPPTARRKSASFHTPEG